MVVHHGRDASQIVAEVGTDRVLQSRFVYASDDGTNEGVLKARWCIKGYLDPDMLDVKTASPTLSDEGFAVTLQILASHRWDLVIADIEGAFLRGDTIQREKGKILVSLPRDGVPGLASTPICELIKPVYGLVDAPKLWWDSLTKTLRQLGMIQSGLDSCIFYSRTPSGELQGIVAFHVDDLLIGGTKEFFEKQFTQLKHKYPFKHVKQGEGEFLGKVLEQRDDSSIVVQQKEYADTLESIHITKERRKEKDSETTSAKKTQMRGVLGEIQWLVTGSRPDLAAGCSLLQQKIAKDLIVQDLIEVNR